MDKDKALRRQMAKTSRVIDQEWAACIDAIRGSVIGEILVIRELCLNDDPAALINRMTEDHEAADFIQRLSMLALDEAMCRMVQQDADEVAE